MHDEVTIGARLRVLRRWRGMSLDEVVGMLALSASLAAASVRRGDVARHWLGEAEALAGRIPDAPMTAWGAFSATNVSAWKVTVGLELGESGRGVLHLAPGIRPDRALWEDRLYPSRRAAVLANVGRGLARERATHVEAVRWLLRAERIAPQRIRNSGAVRETVTVLLSRARAEAGGRELRGMAARMGVPH